MSTQPRIALKPESMTPFGIIDPFPSYDQRLWDAFKPIQALSYASPGLDPATANVLRVHMAEVVDCGICKLMRNVAAEMDASSGELLEALDGDEAPPALAAASKFLQAFASDPRSVDDATWAELRRHFDEQGIASLVLLLAFGTWSPKQIIVCGLEPPEGTDILGAFDATKFDVDVGTASMVPDEPTEEPGG